ncbi:multidrug efflux pump subunit AcrA (membrane-fusion protein) [Rhodoblastus acidophilus]|uniref:efflux RND transporter periplasmic adaptor subunit n=1 Tax=Rhodoblastus acidophilus TaxID=1074 RepID=UPI002224899E|nr:HlyD family efflux transporter periplasmic adaptor subunit [Rhodoblastus acidophilus]MCW2285952.1 multidrug efflux pump subunit AcrA (membrane-fusion protein) [Rhodoblastus acidophilus]MCW2334846.1 multidrug efflux pump subunit AcrA (membrane-fusion protein) [Rhodoblastus acidophilus]
MKNGATLVLALAWALPMSPAAAEGGGEATPLSVSVRAAKPMCFTDMVRATGTIGAAQTADAGASREGMKLTELLVEPLQRVAANQILARLTPLDGSPASEDVRSPASGLVMSAPSATGAPVSSRQGPLFRIAVRGELELRSDVSAQDVAKLKLGQTATIYPVGGPPLSGKLAMILPNLNPARQSGQVLIKILSEGDARVGTFARAEIAAGERCGVGTPYSAVSYEADGTIVFVVANKRVEGRLVSLGMISGDDVEVTSGLKEGELVVLRSAAFVRDGELVTAIQVE